MCLETINDPYLKIKPGSKLKDFILHELGDDKDLPENILKFKNCTNKQRPECFLTLNNIKWIKQHLSKQSVKNVYIHKLLSDTTILLPKPNIIPRNPDLEARIKKLKAEQEARDYKAMTKSVDSFRKHLPEDTLAYQMKAMNKQLIAVAQFIFSVLAGFAFGFIGLELIFGDLDFGFRLLLGIMCALIVSLAEIYFLAKKLNEDYDEVPYTTTKLHQE